ncbi:carboxypeptidase N subunit 2 [Drosophila albomicans]|uniref:Carboxypeptidase N subunit 2 n=1 Tax=Drosophila albomicans TaxID=7291 RepID=A0A9C6T096_DROAB|nr:carboxypeptidase N subunit 2 [Drosophila albomicans]
MSSAMCCYLYLYLLWMWLMMGLNSCESTVKNAAPKQVSVSRLECNENLCTELNYPLDSQVAYFSNEIGKTLGNYTSLVLHNSQLTHLPLNVFQTLKQLETLDVYGCEVQHVTRECFRSAGKLKKLQLGGNLISKLDGDTFALATQLEELELADNELQELPAKLFSGLRQLRKLLLQGNRLKVLPTDAFVQLQHLQHLNVDYNQLTKLPAGLCGKQEELQDFSARGNQLQQVAGDAFATVQRLCLSDNPQLHTLHLKGKVRQLEANNCNLKSLKLDQAQQLEQLQLSNSKLRNFDFLRSAQNLLELDLSGVEKLPVLPNPWPAKLVERLSISRDNPGDWTDKIISQMPQLKYLDVLRNGEREIFLIDDDDDNVEQLDDNDWLCDKQTGECPTVEVGEADELLWTGDGFETIS